MGGSVCDEPLWVAKKRLYGRKGAKEGSWKYYLNIMYKKTYSFFSSSRLFRSSYGSHVVMTTPECYLHINRAPSGTDVFATFLVLISAA